MSQLGSPINSSLNFGNAGNPYLGVMAGPAGLAQQYQQTYNSALSANTQNYQNINQGYNTVMQNVGQTLGQGGTPWGVAAPAAQAIGDVYQQQAGGAFQNSINKGIGNTTAASAAQRGAGLDAQKAYSGLGSQLAQTYAGYQSNLGQGQLNFMNSVQIPYPNAGEYASLYQQYGSQQQSAANMALLQQAQRQSMFAANRPGQLSGVSTPQMPGVNRGGGVSSGSNAMPGMSNGIQYGTPGTTNNSLIGAGSSSGALNSYVNNSENTVGGYGNFTNSPYTGSGYGAGSQDAATASGSYDPAAGSYGDMTGHFGFAGMASPFI